jgi:hypothetical protein
MPGSETPVRQIAAVAERLDTVPSAPPEAPIAAATMPHAATTARPLVPAVRRGVVVRQEAAGRLSIMPALIGVAAASVTAMWLLRRGTHHPDR